MEQHLINHPLSFELLKKVNRMAWNIGAHGICKQVLDIQIGSDLCMQSKGQWNPVAIWKRA